VALIGSPRFPNHLLRETRALSITNLAIAISGFRASVISLRFQLTSGTKASMIDMIWGTSTSDRVVDRLAHHHGRRVQVPCPSRERGRAPLVAWLNTSLALAGFVADVREGQQDVLTGPHRVVVDHGHLAEAVGKGGDPASR
jgi:hypothetical protein